jgi:protein-disulfide isomerase
LPQIEEKYIKTGKVRYVYRDFPLNFHQYAQKAAEAAECADEQRKFWEYHDILFQKQSEWVAVGESKFKEYAQQLDLDMQRFNQCLDSGKYASEVQKDYNDGLKYGVSGTPTFFINGIKIVGAQPYSVFEQIIEQELNK